MRLVLDTNTIVSGLFWGGAPRKLLDLAYRGQIAVYTSNQLILELEDVVGRAKFARFLLERGATQRTVAQKYASIATFVHPPKFPVPVCSDPDDDMVLECELAANADAIVSGDSHLLMLTRFQGIEILRVATLLARISTT